MKREHDIIWHQTIDSTNSEAARRMSEIDNLSVIAAEFQTAGRGQRGNRWNSKAAENLTFSIIVRPGVDGIPAIPAAGQFVVSEITALTTVRYLDSKGIAASIKWPNDIYFNDSKICGILIENCVREGLLLWSICGVGINLNQETFPSDIPNPVSVKLITGKECILSDELLLWTECFDHVADLLSMPDGKEKIERMYLDKMYRKGIRAAYLDTLSGETFYGCIQGISETGCLRVIKEDGSLKDFAFKEIQYII